MIKRVFKTIFIPSLCIGITIPSNAAVSVSDNSAFITRAEALAVAQSISERIIMLENTVDEKIDNLITAYLERNGVWGAQEQTSQNTDVTTHTNDVTLSGSNYVGEQVLFANKFIENTTKSGIFSANILYYGTDYGGYTGSSPNLNECRVGYTGNFTTSDTNWYSNVGFDLSCSIYEDNTDDKASHNSSDYINFSELKSTVLIGTAYGQRKVTSSISDYIACINLPAYLNPMIRPVTFFVKKNSSLWWTMRSNYRFPNQSSASAVRAGGNAGANIHIYMRDTIIN